MNILNTLQTYFYNVSAIIMTALCIALPFIGYFVLTGAIKKTLQEQNDFIENKINYTIAYKSIKGCIKTFFIVVTLLVWIIWFLSTIF